MFKDVNQSITDIKQSIVQLDTRITSLEATGTTNPDIENRLKVLESKYNQIATMSSDITDIKAKLNNINVDHENLYSGVKAYNESLNYD